MKITLNKVRRAIHNPKLIKSHLLNRKRQLQYKFHYYRASFHLPYAPLKVRIEPTNKCNLRCVMCPTGTDGLNRRRSGFMDFEFYRNMINQVGSYPYPTWVELYLGGEPLLHKDLVQMITFAKDRDLLVTLNTNATLLTEERADAILQSGLDHIELSFDDVSPQEYESMRRNAKYDMTLRNIMAFLERKRELGLRFPIVKIASLKLRNSSPAQDRELEPSSRFRELFSNFEVEICCDWAHLWAGSFNQNPLYRFERTGSSHYPRCNLLWRDLTINWEGKAVACCYDLKYDYIVGNAKEKTLLEIWNDNGMIGLRKVAFACDYKSNKLCRSCSFVLGYTKRDLGNRYWKLIEKHYNETKSGELKG